MPLTDHAASHPPCRIDRPLPDHPDQRLPTGAQPSRRRSARRDQAFGAALAKRGHRWLAGGMAVLALSAAQAAVPTATELFNWAERTYPTLLPGHQDNRTQAPYVYRFYPATGNYIAVQDDVVLVLGPVSNHAVMAVGRLADFTCQVLPQSCAAELPVALAARLAPALGYILAVDPAGRVLTWGAYLTGTQTEAVAGSQARAIKGVPTARAVFANGSGNGYAITTDGRVFRWGDVWATTESPATELAGLRDVKDLIACGARVLALNSGGTLQEWTGLPGGAPWALEGMSGFEALAEHTEASGGCASYAIRTDGSVWRVGGKASAGAQASWVQVVGLPPIQQLACGTNHCLALARTGRVWAWGYNDWGQLGTGTTLGSVAPVEVAGLADVRKVAAGAHSSYALSRAGQVYRWGRHGVLVRLGRITDTQELAPTPVPGAPADIVDIHARVQATWGGLMMVRRNGRLLGWGPNNGGELIDAARQNYVDLVSTVGTIDIGASNPAP